MLTKKTPDTIKATLTVKAQGVENVLQLTYHNHAADKLDAFRKNPENLKAPDNVEPGSELAMTHSNAAIVQFLVKSFDDGTDAAFPLNRAGLIELEQHWPGALFGIAMGYHKVRGAEVEKN